MEVRVRRLRSGDEEAARALFALMEEVFETPGEPLGDVYLQLLLEDDRFWAMAAFDSGRIVGGMTAHTLRMTRSESSEIFIYDLAVREDVQRRGVGRRLMMELRDQAAAAGIRVLFVPAEDEDEHALHFYRAVGGVPSPVTFFTFGDDDEGFGDDGRPRTDDGVG
ncbi:GNAT family N-acetyltransferase [Longimicrobium terrae]|uniref:Aminoglycoside 3-N-acetyltransferase I n=1 Tax=Longimicrobium terrae TaxID=1639882 RepID=A0A841GVC5_9BACT|nr:aminoglycoside 3-N-acetyltransferase I [Longimicrobium terrae]MBB6069243.1 aminoglycoside 3-N-acetyltransferase I [Longimicrobium terrae]NNC31947.1 GNAT family N-acetyltransferase [Longimicrobium terrae]